MGLIGILIGFAYFIFAVSVGLILGVMSKNQYFSLRSVYLISFALAIFLWLVIYFWQDSSSATVLALCFMVFAHWGIAKILKRSIYTLRRI
jgi:Na+/melibiose symporter-like transporter